MSKKHTRSRRKRKELNRELKSMGLRAEPKKPLGLRSDLSGRFHDRPYWRRMAAVQRKIEAYMKGKK